MKILWKKKTWSSSGTNMFGLSDLGIRTAWHSSLALWQYLLAVVASNLSTSSWTSSSICWVTLYWKSLTSFVPISGSKLFIEEKKHYNHITVDISRLSIQRRYQFNIIQIFLGRGKKIKRGERLGEHRESMYSMVTSAHYTPENSHSLLHSSLYKQQRWVPEYRSVRHMIKPACNRSLSVGIVPGSKNRSLVIIMTLVLYI